MNKVIKVEYKGYCEDCDLGEESICEAIGKDFEWAVYRYGTGSYEGDGNMIHKKNGKYYMSVLSHCSCYGPLENISAFAYASIEEITKVSSEGLNAELEDIVKAVKYLES